MAFTSITALAAGQAVNAALVLGAMVEVGTVMTVVGAVTGNKDIAKIGGTMALVGGVGGLIAGAGSAIGAAEASNATQQGFGELAAQGADAALDAGASGMAAPEVVDFAATPGIAEVSPLPQTPEASFEVAKLPDLGPAEVGAQFKTRDSKESEKGNSFFSGVFDFIKNPKNKELVNTGAKVIGGAFEGMQKSDEFDRTQGLREGEFAFRQAQSANVKQQNKSRSGIIQQARA